MKSAAIFLLNIVILLKHSSFSESKLSNTVSAKETLESTLKCAQEKSNDYQIQIESLQKDLAVSQDELSKFTEKSEKLQNLTAELQDQLKAKEDEHDKALDKLEVI